MTSAPRSAMSLVQYGPLIVRQYSRTLMPSNALPAIVEISCSAVDIHRSGHRSSSGTANLYALYQPVTTAQAFHWLLRNRHPMIRRAPYERIPSWAVRLESDEGTQQVANGST